MKRFIYSLFFSSIVYCLPAQASIWYVNQLAAGANSGQSWADAYTDLHQALEIAQSGDAIWVAKGVYFPDTAFNRDRYFELKSGIKIFGGFNGTESALPQRNLAGNPVMLSGNIGNPADSTDNSYTILYMAYPDTSTRIDGFIFRHGFARNDTNFYTDVPVSSGGAVFIMAQNGKALPVFANCTFQDNAARFNGGAVYVQGQGAQGSTPLFQNCDFINNKARIGGAIYLKGGNGYDRGIEFDHCRFEGNYSLTQGGSIYFYNTLGNETLDFSGCVVTKNNCNSYGCFFAYYKAVANPFSINIDNCQITSNGPNASSLIQLETQISEFKTKVIIANSSLISNTLSHPFGMATFLLGIPNSSLTGVVDTMIILNNNIRNNISKFTSDCNPGFYIFEKNTLIDGPGFIAGGNNTIYSDNLHVNNPALVYFLGGAGSKCIVKNNLFLDNKTLPGLTIYQGGDILGIGDSIHVFNNLFLGNVIAIKQYSFGVDSLTYVANLSNNIFLQNHKIILQDSANSFAYFSHNLMDTVCDGLADRVTCGPGNTLASDARFVDTAAFDFHLLPCSPAINKGDNTLLQALGIVHDMEGNPRIAEGIVDIGPLEAPAFALSTPPAIHPACANTPGGAITLDPVNGCEPYTYQWQPAVGSGAEVNELPPGNYAFTVTDGSGRQLADAVQVPSVASPALSPVAQDLQCGSLIGGTATVAINSGTPPFSFEWSTSATDSLLTMLPAGSYAVTVTDGNGCQASALLSIAQQGQLTLMVSGEVISCFGASDGSLSTAALNGKAPITYLWSPQGATDSLINGLGPGVYSVTATDFYGCTASFNFTLGEPMLLQASVVATPANSLQNPNGTASATPVSGGTQPYTFLWNTGGQNQSINGLVPGTYTVTLTDAHDCTATATAEVMLVSSTGEADGLQVQVWPNPMRERLEIKALGLPSGQYRFVLRDALGREVRSAEVTGGRAVLEVITLPNGSYSWELVGRKGQVLKAGKVVR